MSNEEKFKAFIDTLNKLKDEKKVLCLYRGMECSYAFDTFNLVWDINTMDQFAERLFFFGEKSKAFWNRDIKERRNLSINNHYDLNDLSEEFFIYVFDSFNSITSNKELKVKQEEYISRNKTTFEFFQKKENLISFLDKINSISTKEKREIKEHYLVILHQLGGSSYNDNSHYVSSSKNQNKAKWYSKDEIVIHFWDLDIKQSMTRLPLSSKLPCFIGKPFKNDKEISLFACIFPHYIHSFTYKKQQYFNPAILGATNFEYSILNGLKIDQSNFLTRLKNETSHQHGVNRIKYEDEYSYKEIYLTDEKD